jgi:hypothetical protein
MLAELTDGAIAVIATCVLIIVACVTAKLIDK